MLKAGFRCSTAGMRLILQGIPKRERCASDARAMLAPQTSPELDYRPEIKELRLRTVTGAKPGASYGNRAAWCAYGTDKCLVFQPSRCWTQACCTCVPQVLPLLLSD